MTWGLSNVAIGAPLVVTERAIAHTSGIFAELGLEVPDDDNRRVPAVLAYLDRGHGNAAGSPKPDHLPAPGVK